MYGLYLQLNHQRNSIFGLSAQRSIAASALVYKDADVLHNYTSHQPLHQLTTMTTIMQTAPHDRCNVQPRWPKLAPKTKRPSKH
jgi:hypothetical protein